ncbi:DUF397 domain-containing protein [Streptomyces sp. NPDC023723]|uniref:DUF397 domain-containing protein n=1 Tax=Streptomyces sp. NPDC023723 TaxID=3154323 RepID=UPI0034044735
MSELHWFKSSFSEASGNACVEVALREDEQVAIRHSVRPARALAVDRTAFGALVRAVRAGDLRTP